MEFIVPTIYDNPCEEASCSFCGWTDGEHASGCPYEPADPACPKCGILMDFTAIPVFGDSDHSDLGTADEFWRCSGCSFVVRER